MAALVVDDAFDLAELHRQVARLPDYARPLFIRFCPRLDITETFKQKSRRLVDEGFDPDVVGDGALFRRSAPQAYVRLDQRLLAQIETGLVRLWPKESAGNRQGMGRESERNRKGIGSLDPHARRLLAMLSAPKRARRPRTSPIGAAPMRSSWT